MSGTTTPTTPGYLPRQPNNPRPAMLPAGPPYPNTWIDQPTPNNQSPWSQFWFDPASGLPVTFEPGTVETGGDSGA